MKKVKREKTGAAAVDRTLMSVQVDHLVDRNLKNPAVGLANPSQKQRQPQNPVVLAGNLVAMTKHPGGCGNRKMEVVTQHLVALGNRQVAVENQRLVAPANRKVAVENQHLVAPVNRKVAVENQRLVVLGHRKVVVANQRLGVAVVNHNLINKSDC